MTLIASPSSLRLIGIQLKLSIMSKKKVVIKFKSIYQLWAYAQAIQAYSIEIIASEMILICDCSDKDLRLITEYEGLIVENYTPAFSHTSTSKEP